MNKHRRFADGAGFTQHCWECIHAKDWHEDLMVKYAICEVYGICVEREDSPNNGSNYIGKICSSYDRGEGK